MSSSVKYSRVPTDETSLDFSSIFTYSNPNSMKAKSFFTYSNGGLKKDRQESEVSMSSRVIESFVIVVSFLGVVLTMPLSLIFCIKFIPDGEKCVVFRLGRLQKSKGPGTVLILPCIDRWERVDMKTRAFNIPPIQAVTNDGGVIEFGGNVLYNVKDAIQSVVGVKDLGPSIRTLAHTIVHREMNKGKLADIVGDRKKCGAELKTELNKATLGWGIEIRDVELYGASDIRIVKQASTGGGPADQINEVLGAIFRSVAGTGGGLPVVPGLNGLSQPPPGTFVSATQAYGATGGMHEDEMNPLAGGSSLNAHTVVALLQQLLSVDLVASVGAIFQFDITDLGSSIGLDLKNGSGSVWFGPAPNADVKITMSKDDCLQLFTGSLAPLDAYMQGRIQVEGDLRTALQLQALRDAVRVRGASMNSAGFM